MYFLDPWAQSILSRYAIRNWSWYTLLLGCQDGFYGSKIIRTIAF